MAEIAGLTLITPSSVAGSGVSLSGAKVVFTAATSISVNGVFDSTYDNYLVVCRGSTNTSNAAIALRMRLAGSDNSTASSYVTQRLAASNTSVTGVRTTANSGDIALISSTQRDGFHCYFYGPALAQPTAGRTVTVESDASACIFDYAFTHNQSTSYDGFTLTPNANNLTGALTIYGLSQ